MTDKEVIEKLRQIQSELEDSVFELDKYNAIETGIYYIEKYGVN